MLSLAPSLKEESWKVSHISTSPGPSSSGAEPQLPDLLRWSVSLEQRAWTAFRVDSNVWGPPNMAR